MRPLSFFRPAPAFPLATLAALALALPARAATYYSNLAEPSDFQTTFGTNLVAHSFTTDHSATSFNLDSVTPNFEEAGGLGTTGFSLQLYSNGASQPGSLLATGSGSSSPTSAGDHAYTFSSVELQPDTTYWLVSGVSSGSYIYTKTIYPTHAGSWSAAPGDVTSSNGGGTWNQNFAVETYKFAVAASPVPEPSTCALLLGLPVLALAFYRRRPLQKIDFSPSARHRKLKT